MVRGHCSQQGLQQKCRGTGHTLHSEAALNHSTAFSEDCPLNHITNFPLVYGFSLLQTRVSVFPGQTHFSVSPKRWGMLSYLGLAVSPLGDTNTFSLGSLTTPSPTHPITPVHFSSAQLIHFGRPEYRQGELLLNFTSFSQTCSGLPQNKEEESIPIKLSQVWPGPWSALHFTIRSPCPAPQERQGALLLRTTRKVAPLGGCPWTRLQTWVSGHTGTHKHLAHRGCHEARLLQEDSFPTPRKGK